MIVVILQGGLGNQMFQYAAGRQLAKLRNTKLMLDLSWYEKAKQDDGVGKRVYELAPMAIEENIYKLTLANRAIFKATRRTPYNDESQPYIFHKEVLKLPKNSRLFGYFQNGRYFKDIRELLLKEFTLKKPATGKNKELLAAITKNDNTVSAHIRRGDYATSAVHGTFHGLKGPEYYKKAAELIKKTVAKPTFYVFSDDPEWCKKNIKLGGPTTYVDHNKYGGEDMRLMRACRHNIVANSSFSWWGAWLNENPDKVIIAPKQWINDTKVDSSDTVPKDWLRL